MKEDGQLQRNLDYTVVGRIRVSKRWEPCQKGLWGMYRAKYRGILGVPFYGVHWNKDSSSWGSTLKPYIFFLSDWSLKVMYGFQM